MRPLVIGVTVLTGCGDGGDPIVGEWKLRGSDLPNSYTSTDFGGSMTILDDLTGTISIEQIYTGDSSSETYVYDVVVDVIEPEAEYSLELSSSTTNSALICTLDKDDLACTVGDYTYITLNFVRQ